LIPKFIIGKKYRRYILFLTLVLTLHYFVRTGIINWLIYEGVLPSFHEKHELFSFNHVVALTLGEIYVIGLVSAIKYTIDYVVELNKNNRLLALQTETEMKYLKAQIQPHFFFNVLNSLYALTLSNSKKASEVVLKLSEIMEYVIYDTSKKRIPLPKEINYVKNYIELEKMRRGDSVHYNIETFGNIENVALPPFLFLPFVENCFKHGQLDNGEITIDMVFKKSLDGLEFSIKNYFEKNRLPQKKTGIGLNNIRRRLELLYGTDFELMVSSQGNQYLVDLKIPLQ